MPSMKLMKGIEPWIEKPINETPMLIGRDSRRCAVVLNQITVSRKHACIDREGGTYSIVDLGSHSGTFLNGRQLEKHKRYRLFDKDKIQICDYVFSFSHRVKRDADASRDAAKDDSSSSCSSSVLDSSYSAWSNRTNINPEAKLKAILELSKNLRASKTLEELLGTVLETLLTLFGQADCGVIMLTQSKLRPALEQVVRCRRVADQREARIDSDVIADVVGKQVSMVSWDGQLAHVPLIDAEGQSLGLIQLERQGKGRFTAEDLDVLSTAAVEASLGLDNWILREVAARQRQLQYELKVARDVQLALLPDASPEVPGYDFFEHYAPAMHVGGDQYDYVLLDNEKLALLLGDVAGKGVPAALLMAKVSSEASIHLAANADPATVLQRLNARLNPRHATGRFVTLIAAVLDLTRHEMTLANAGHMPPLLRRHAGQVDEITHAAPGLPLGVYPDQTYEASRFSLASGDTLVLFTDGVTEATNVSGEAYGTQRLRDRLAAARGSAEEIGGSIMRDVWSFVGDQPQTDDICLVCVHRQSA